MLYHREVRNVAEYLSDRDVAQIYSRVVDPVLRGFFKNKVLFHHHFEGSSVRMTRLLGHCHKPGSVAG
jgi:hypothetical protein